MTKGEEVFLKYCRLAEIEAKRIETVHGVRTPDYKLRVEDAEVFVEIKDNDENWEEKTAKKELNKLGWAVWGSGRPGARIQKKIKDGSGQLRNAAAKGISTVLLLYDNRSIEISNVYEYEIKVAMYGLETLSNIGGRIPVRRFGTKRQMTNSERRYISAIGVLSSEAQIDLYLNYFAEQPLAIPTWRSIKGVTIHKLALSPDQGFGDWVQVI